MADADDFFAEVKGEGATLDIDKAFDRLDKKGENPSEARTEKEETKEPEATEVPKENKKWAEMRRSIDEAKREAADAKREAEALKKASETPQPPKWWVDRFGDTEEARQSYAQTVQKDGELDWIKQAVKEDLKQESQAEQATADEAQQYVDAQISDMTDEGLKFEKNSLLKFMVDFQEEFGPGSLLDKDGNYDFRKSLKLMQQMQPEETEDNSVRKGLAAQAGRSKVSTERTSKIPIVSTRVLRKGGWREAGI